MTTKTIMGSVLAVSVLGVVASAWLGCALDDKWSFACFVQGCVFALGVAGSVSYFATEYSA